MKKIIAGLIVFSYLLFTFAHAEELLTATIIGSSSPNYNEERASASTLISLGDTHILVDMGNGTQANLHRLGFDLRDLSSLLFTHHHLDHNEEFVPIFIRTLLGRNAFTIIGPPNTTKLTQANLSLYEEDIAYRLSKTQRVLDERKGAFNVKDINGGESFNIGDIRITTLKVPHTIHTIAYRFDYNQQSIVITGDLTYSEALPTLAQHADFMIIDAGGMIMEGGRSNKKNTKKKTGKKNNQDKKRKNKKDKNKQSKKAGGRAHLNLADSSLLASKANVKNLVYTHFNKGVVDTKASLKEIRKNYSGNVIFSKDLMVIRKRASTNHSTVNTLKTTLSNHEHHNINHVHDKVNNRAEAIDITNVIFTKTTTHCADYVNDYTSSAKDINENTQYSGSLKVTLKNNTCVFTSNAIPNHHFNDGDSTFRNKVSEQAVSYSIPQNPSVAAQPTAISLRTDNAIFLNGVKLDLLSAGCFGVGRGFIGCKEVNQPFRYDPMSPLNSFATDSHNAHTQPDGTYHYHGNPLAMFIADSTIESPVIGFAADGYPIYGSYFNDNGMIRKATSSYVLKNNGGARADVTFSGKLYSPGGVYDGKYVDDYQYKESSGDLDQCNGMTVNGQYGYYVTDNYPWVLKCFTGTPDASFKKGRR